MSPIQLKTKFSSNFIQLKLTTCLNKYPVSYSVEQKGGVTQLGKGNPNSQWDKALSNEFFYPLWKGGWLTVLVCFFGKEDPVNWQPMKWMVVQWTNGGPMMVVHWVRIRNHIFLILTKPKGGDITFFFFLFVGYFFFLFVTQHFPYKICSKFNCCNIKSKAWLFHFFILTKPKGGNVTFSFFLFVTQHYPYKV